MFQFVCFYHFTYQQSFVILHWQPKPVLHSTSSSSTSSLWVLIIEKATNFSIEWMANAKPPPPPFPSLCLSPPLMRFCFVCHKTKLIETSVICPGIASPNNNKSSNSNRSPVFRSYQSPLSTTLGRMALVYIHIILHLFILHR